MWAAKEYLFYSFEFFFGHSSRLIMYDHTRPEGHILTFGTEMEREAWQDDGHAVLCADERGMERP
jgi:hypothetical protein